MSSTATAIDLTATGKRNRTDSMDAGSGAVQPRFIRPRTTPRKRRTLTAEELQMVGLQAQDNEPHERGVRHSGHRFNVIGRFLKEVLEKEPFSLVSGNRLVYEDSIPRLLTTHRKWYKTQGLQGSTSGPRVYYVDCTTPAPPGLRIAATNTQHTVMSYHWDDPATRKSARPKRYIFFVVDPVPYEDAIMHMLFSLTDTQLRLIAKAGALAIDQIFNIPELQAAYNPGS